MNIAVPTGLLGRLALVAGAVTAVLGLALLVGAVLVVSRGVPESWPPAPESLAAGRLQLPEEGAGVTGAMIDRPLFWQSRRPVEEVAAVVEDEPWQRGPEPFDKAKLAGVFASGPDSGVILSIDKQRERVLVGGDTHNWQLVSLTSDSATFVRLRSGEERVLKLEHAFVPVPKPSAETETEADSP